MLVWSKKFLSLEKVVCTSINPIYGICMYITVLKIRLNIVKGSSIICIKLKKFILYTKINIFYNINSLFISFLIKLLRTKVIDKLVKYDEFHNGVKKRGVKLLSEVYWRYKLNYPEEDS